MIIRSRAIVLNHLKYGDTGLIATLYTEELGRLSVMAKGVYGKKNGLRSGLFQPLSLLEITAYYDPRRDLHTLREAAILVPLTSIPFDPVKNCIALFLSEVLYKSLREEVNNPELFHFLYHSMQILDLCAGGTANFHLIFLMQLSKYLGFSPIWPDIEAGRHRNDAEISAWYYRLMESGYEQMDGIEMDHIARNSLVKSIMQWYGQYIESCLDVKSLPVLTSVFAS